MPQFHFNRFVTQTCVEIWNANSQFAYHLAWANIPELKKMNDEGQLVTIDGMKKGLSNALFNAMDRGIPVIPIEWQESFNRFADNTESRFRKCINRIAEIRREFFGEAEPHGSPIDNPEFDTAIRTCIKNHFPPLMKFSGYIAALEEYFGMTTSLVSGFANDTDLNEMEERVEFFSFWADSLKIPEIPDPPINRRDPLLVQNYLRQLRNAVFKFRDYVNEKVKDRKAEHEKIEATLSEKSSSANTKDDGPHPPNEFWWSGKVLTLEPKPHALLASMWKNRTQLISEIETEVWGDEAETDSRLKVAMSRANTILATAGLQISKRGKWLKLE